MKRTLVLALLSPLLLGGCGGDTVRAFLGSNPTPAPAPTPVANAKASPTPGNWMWKDYKNPLDPQKKKK